LWSGVACHAGFFIFGCQFAKGFEDRGAAQALSVHCCLQQGNESSHFMLRNYSGFLIHHFDADIRFDEAFCQYGW